MSETIQAPVVVESTGSGTTPFLVSNSNGNEMARFVQGTSGHGNLMILNSEGKVKVKLAAGTDKSYINNGKNVGIGTTSPNTLLDVRGTVTCSQLKITDASEITGLPDGHYLLAIDSSTGKVYRYTP